MYQKIFWMDPAFSRTSQALGTPIANALESKFQFYRNALDIKLDFFENESSGNVCTPYTVR